MDPIISKIFESGINTTLHNLTMHISLRLFVSILMTKPGHYVMILFGTSSSPTRNIDEREEIEQRHYAERRAMPHSQTALIFIGNN